jgi:hypothetical protein
LATAIEPAGDDNAEEAAMEGHAAVPGLENVERVLQVEERLVEQHIAQPAAEHDAEKREDEEVIRFGGVEGGRVGPPQAGLAGQILDVPDGKKQPHDISQRVPVDGEGADLEGHGIDAGMADDGEHGLLICVNHGAAKCGLGERCGAAALESPGQNA